MHALVFANGQPPSAELIATLLRPGDRIIAADGGAAAALAAGLDVFAVVGDLDSITETERAAIPAERLHEVARPDRTDLEKAIEFALEQGCTEIDIVGAGGGRADHALANLAVLTTFAGQARMCIHDELFAVRLVEGESRIAAPVGTL